MPPSDHDRLNTWAHHAVQADTSDQFWWKLLLRISQAGACYSVVMMAFWGLLMALWSLSPLAVLGTLLGFLLVWLIPLTFGFLYSVFVGGFVLPATWLALKALRRRSGPDRIGMFAGGLVAFLCMMPLQIQLFNEGQYRASSVPASLILWLMIPGAAITFGQIGGALAAPHTLRARRLDPNLNRFELGLPRFSIAQLLGLMVVLSVTLSLLKLTGLLTVPVMIAACVWAGFQTVSATPAAWVANRLLARYRRSRARHSKKMRSFRLHIERKRGRIRST